MLTINHVEDNGHESIREARSVSFDPGAGISSCGERRLTVSGVDGTERHEIFNHGRVYVMNGSGKTVAKYDLDAATPIQR